MSTFCPCCLEKLTVVGVQHYPAKFNLPSKTLVHCVNETCPMYMATSTNILSTWEAYGKPSLTPCGGQFLLNGDAHETKA